MKIIHILKIENRTMKSVGLCGEPDLCFFAFTNQSRSNPALFCSKLSEYFVIQDDSIPCNAIHKTTGYTGVKCSIWGTKIA